MMKKLGLVLMVASALGGCSMLPREAGLTPDTPTPPDMKRPDTAATVTPAAKDQNPETIFETLNEDVFLLKQLDSTEALPALNVPAMSFSNASPFEIIRAIVESVNLGVALVGENANANVQRGTVTAWNVGGSLSAVLERMSRYTGLFYTYQGGVLTFTPDAQFMTTLPPIEDLIDPLATSLRSLGATDVSVDRFNRVLSFRSTRTMLPRIESYLKHIRERRQVITYDVSIYEVQLNDASSLGVNWNRFAVGGKPANVWYNAAGNGAGSSSTTGSTGTGTTAATGLASLLPSWFPFSNSAGDVARQAVNVSSAPGGGLSVNPFFVLPGLNADVVVNFLQTQGTLRSISQPRVSLVTGTKAAVRVGNTTTYVSKIGTNTGAAISSTNVETAQLKTGVDLHINADYQNGTVYTDLQIAINDLIRLRTYVALGTTLQLPDTSDRLIETRVRARPGDTIVIGGIQRDTFNNDVEGVPGMGNAVMPTSKQKQVSRSELVVTLRPRVVTFVSAKAAPTLAPQALASVVPVAAPVAAPVAMAPAALPLAPLASVPTVTVASVPLAAPAVVLATSAAPAPVAAIPTPMPAAVVAAPVVVAQVVTAAVASPAPPVPTPAPVPVQVPAPAPAPVPVAAIPAAVPAAAAAAPAVVAPALAAAVVNPTAAAAAQVPVPVPVPVQAQAQAQPAVSPTLPLPALPLAPVARVANTAGVERAEPAAASLTTRYPPATPSAFASAAVVSVPMTPEVPLAHTLPVQVPALLVATAELAATTPVSELSGLPLVVPTPAAPPPVVVPTTPLPVVEATAVLTAPMPEPALVPPAPQPEPAATVDKRLAAALAPARVWLTTLMQAARAALPATAKPDAREVDLKVVAKDGAKTEAKLLAAEAKAEAKPAATEADGVLVTRAIAEPGVAELKEIKP